MTNFVFRPWGRPLWVCEKYGQASWTVLACLGTEKRSVVSASQLARFATKVILVKVEDPKLGTPEFLHSQASAFGRNRDYYDREAPLAAQYESADLKASIDRIEEVCRSAAESGSVILDISSFPKRWFFPMLRFLVSDDSVQNLQVVYTRGTSHAKVLAESPETLRVLPTFATMDARDSHDVAFVGVGFHLHSMLTMFGNDRARAMHLLFPFPPGPPGIQRNWKFVQQVERVVQRDATLLDGADPINFLHLDSNDVSLAFDAMRMASNGGKKTSMMAPYGPKPFSLAMCLFAIAAERARLDDIPVYYSQPKKYAVDYTADAASRLGALDTWSYAIKRAGRFLYEM